MPWAMKEPSTLDETRDRLERRAVEFSKGEAFQYSIFDPAEEEIFGGVGLHPRTVAGCLEIGYWIRADQLSRGFATEAARELALEALRLPGVDRVQIDCDPANIRSPTDS